jgi:hypothetical protein
VKGSVGGSVPSVEPAPIGANEASTQVNRRYPQELDAGEVISQTFKLYGRNFSKYLVVFLLVEAAVGILDTLLRAEIPLPTLPTSLNPGQTLSFLPGYFESLFTLLVFVVLVSLMIGSIATGAAVRLTSDEIDKGQTSVEASLRFAVSKLPSIWAINVLFAIILGLGSMALLVPGIILGIMFSLALPVIMIENSGVLDSLGRSRLLVGHRWLQSFAIYLLFGVIMGGAAWAVNLVSVPFGTGTFFVSSVLSALYAPILPILLTVYYYSNAARIAQPQALQMPASVARFCPSCGEPASEPNQSFCRKCGQDLRPRQG